MALTLNGSTGISGIAGSAGTPALQGNNDANTGYFFAADTLGLSTAGSERLRITAAGNLALGNDGSFPIYTDTNDRNFILGTGSDDAAIQLHSGTDKYGGLYFGDATSGGDRYRGYVEFKHGTNDDYLRFAAGGSERLRIDSSGNIKLGSGATQTLAIKNYGYSGSYKNIMIGNPGSNVGSVGICVDVSTISGGNFAAQHQAILGKNGILMPNNAGDNFIGVLRRDSNADKLYIGPGITSGLTSGPLTLESTNVGIGTTSPVGNLEVRGTKANLIVAKTGLTVKANSDIHTTYDLIQLGAGGGLASYSSATATADTHLVHNAYRSSGGAWQYRYTDTAMRLRMNSPGGAFIFDSAASGSAGATVSFSEKLRITSSGTVNIGGQTTQTVHSLSVNKSNGNCIQVGNTSGSSAGSHDAQIVASDGTNFNNLKLGGHETKVFANVSGGTGYVETWRFDSSGNLACKLAGKGIDFSVVTPSGTSVDSNTLADYEVGEFTPTWYTESSLVTVNYHTQKGYYVKIGRMVYFQFYIRVADSNAISGGSGNLVLQGLPFTSQSATTHPNVAYGALSFAYTNNWQGTQLDRGLVSSGATKAYMYVGTSSGTNVNAGAGNLDDGTQVRGNGSYIAADYS